MINFSTYVFIYPYTYGTPRPRAVSTSKLKSSLWFYKFIYVKNLQLCKILSLFLVSFCFYTSDLFWIIYVGYPVLKCYKLFLFVVLVYKQVMMFSVLYKSIQYTLKKCWSIYYVYETYILVDHETMDKRELLEKKRLHRNKIVSLWKL